MKNLFKKFTSRKLITAVLGIFAGLCVAFGADGEGACAVAGSIVSVVSAAAYIITEGRLDAEAIKAAAVKVQQAIDAVSDDKEENK